MGIIIFVTCILLSLLLFLNCKKEEEGKHKAPIRCKLWVRIIGISPSTGFRRCRIGCKYKNKKCKRCEENISEQLRDIGKNLAKSLKEGVKEIEIHMSSIGTEFDKIVQNLKETQQNKTNNWRKMHGEVKKSRMTWKKEQKNK